MTKQSALSLIESRVRAACPELMELSFGCEVKVVNENWRLGDRYWHGSVITPSMGIGHYHILTKSEDSKKNGLIKAFNLADRKNTVILGNPITLEHVLKAILHCGHVPSVEGVDAKSNYYDTMNVLIFAKWELGKPLSQQSEPTLLFIAGLLE